MQVKLVNHLCHLPNCFLASLIIWLNCLINVWDFIIGLLLYYFPKNNLVVFGSGVHSNTLQRLSFALVIQCTKSRFHLLFFVLMAFLTVDKLKHSFIHSFSNCLILVRVMANTEPLWIGYQSIRHSCTHSYLGQFCIPVNLPGCFLDVWEETHTDMQNCTQFSGSNLSSRSNRGPSIWVAATLTTAPPWHPIVMQFQGPPNLFLLFTFTWIGTCFKT